MSEFPVPGPLREDHKDPAEKKEMVVDIPKASLPDKIRIRPPEEKEEAQK